MIAMPGGPGWKCVPLLAALFCPSGAVAQQPQQPAPHGETVVVTGVYDPLELDEVDRSVRVLPVKSEELLSNTWIDFLRLDSSLDLGERAPDGVQSDLSIRGGTFGQTLLMIDGQRMNDAQSGHHNMDIPLPVEAIERIEVLRGSGSTLYGSDAVAGVVNVITRRPESTEFHLRTALGNFGVNQQEGSLALVEGGLTEQLSFSRDFLSGFAPDRDYRNLSFTSLTHLVSPLGATELTLAYMDHPFGANNFYGPYNSWENTKTWFGAIRQALGQKTEVSFSFRRHSDLFVLFRNDPAYYTNHHAVETYQLAVRRKESLSNNVKLHYGIEGYHDAILSNNLGDHSRGRAAGYASLDVRALRRFSFSIGAREEVYRSVSFEFSPSVTGGVWLSPHFRLRASASRAFRVPSYTDLYYHDPANLGNPNLRPERAWGYEGGLDWSANTKLRGELVVFQRRESDGIDYVRYSLTDLWRATNIQNLHFTGVEASVVWKWSPAQQIDLRYTGLHGEQDTLTPGVMSQYAFNFPSNEAVAAWRVSLPWGLMARTRVGALQRLRQDAYALWDVYIAESRGRVHPFFQLTNVTNTMYQEIQGVAMPLRSVVGGVEIAVFARK
jgi:iron complex outermembrane receptor protein